MTKRLVLCLHHVDAVALSHFGRPESVVLRTPQLRWEHDDGGVTQFMSISGGPNDLRERLAGTEWDEIEYRCPVSDETRGFIASLVRISSKPEAA